MLAFIAGFWLSWPCLIVLALLGICFEHAKGLRPIAVMLLIALAATAYFFFQLPLATIGIGAVGYLVIGLIWSFWRYKRQVEETVEELKDSSESQKRMTMLELHPKQMVGSITAWIIVWPFSLIDNLIGDLINAIQRTIVIWFRSVYHRIYDGAMVKLGLGGS
jgi:membrane protein implicated in regulation of membrane protease activity